jgi:hypothetical protein
MIGERWPQDACELRRVRSKGPPPGYGGPRLQTARGLPFPSVAGVPFSLLGVAVVRVLGLAMSTRQRKAIRLVAAVRTVRGNHLGN